MVVTYQESEIPIKKEESEEQFQRNTPKSYKLCYRIALYLHKISL